MMTDVVPGARIHSRSQTSVRRWFHRHAALLLLVPVLAYLIAMFAFPIGRVLMLSFFDPQLTLSHYAHFFGNPLYVRVLANTFEIAATVTLICLALGYPVAYVMSGVRTGTAAWMALLIIMPFWISILVRTYAWMVLLGRYGVVNSVLLALGWISEPVRLVGNRFSVIVGMVHYMLPIMVLTIFSVVKNIDWNLVKVSQSLGATKTKAFTTVFLPLSLPGIIAGTLLVFIVSLGFFVTPALLGGSKDLMMASLIESAVNVQPDWGFAACIAVVLLGVTLSLYFVVHKAVGLDKIFERMR